ncbi:hypothetical protein MKEN_01170500 [Mycena kentingensis (nom. inval.)]|nr:hypothetical protein MKEN_01170500 [Mycena kentingensis (nom. inval.)]
MLPQDGQRVLDIASHGWADGSLETYGSGLLLYHAFCDAQRVPEVDRAPASTDLIARFIAFAAGSYAGKTLRTYLAGVQAWHVLHGVAWRLDDLQSEVLLRAATALQPPSSSRKKRKPYTPSILISILSQLDPTNHFDAAVAACLTVAFYSCARLGELTVRNLSDFDPSKHAKPDDIRETTDNSGNAVTSIFIPQTKAAPCGEDIIFARQLDASDPRAALDAHLRINSPPQRAHIFSYPHAKTRRPLTKPAFLKRVHEAMRAAGEEPLQGHGIRIGSTLFYLLRGVPFDVVKTMGRWKSDAFQLYLRKHAQILAPYIQAVPAIDEQFSRRICMPPVRCTSSLS